MFAAMLSTILFVIVLAGCCITVLAMRKLTAFATLIAAVIAICLFIGVGVGGVVLLAAFFIMGVMATAWKHHEKLQDAVLQRDDSQRDARQVMANGGVPALLGIAGICWPDSAPLMLLMTACSCSSAAADTLSSELGVVYGRTAYDILTFRKAKPGDNGLISFAGTVSGLLGSMVIAIIYCVFTEWNAVHFLIIIATGTAGNLFDSLIGATLERRRLIGNNAVNFLNTLLAALLGGLLVAG